MPSSGNLKVNQDAGGITEIAVLEINDAGRVRELYRDLGGIRKTEEGRMLTKSKK